MKPASKALAIVGVVAVLVAGQAQAKPAPLAAGAVAAPDSYGAQAAQEILKKGGNAVDAAVATAFTLAVTYPDAGNLGGGGFMTVWYHGKPYFLDYRETAPAKASRDMYLNAHGDPVSAMSLFGNLASGVPGTVRGLAQAHRRFGKLSWAADLAPAIRAAREGFVVPAELAAERDDSSKDFSGTNFLSGFGAMKAGETFRQPALAATLERIARGGAREFYEGKTADLLVAQMARGKTPGLITRADLAGYKAVWRPALTARWRGYTVVTAPPPSSGGVALLQLLNMKADAQPLFKDVALNSVQYIHLIAEIEKRVFADRAQYMGDPDAVRVPVAALIDPAYLKRRAAEINPAAPSDTAAVKPGLEKPREKPETTHFSIVDKWGNAVSNTYTLNGDFGSGVVVEGAGFLMNDEMDDFSAKSGTPNMFGVVSAGANAIAPGKRPLSSMTPTILVKDGRVALVIGTPGGSRIFTSVFQVMANLYDYRMDLTAALAAPRFHHQLLPANLIETEPFAPFSPDLIAALAGRGYTVKDQGYNGDIELIAVDGGAPTPGSDPRGRGVGLVVR
jgi:gamma-glutamyltranspeptidase/glutathione hydrolase